MRLFVRSRIFAVLVGLGSAGALLAADAVPLGNWTVPGSGGLRKQVDISPGVAFVAVSPCRMVDTRGAVGPYGGPKFNAGEERSYDLNNHPTCTGIPAGVESYSLNLTATQTNGDGFLSAYPTGTAFPGVSTVNYTGVNATIAGAAIVPADGNGSINVIAGVSGTHVVIDINGYFTDEYNANVSFTAIGSNNAQVGLFQNTSVAANTFGLTGTSASITDLSAGVKGVEGSGPPTIIGIEPTAGVLGLSRDSIGVYGISQKTGTEGHVHGSSGTNLGSGMLGHYTGVAYFGVYSEGNAHVNGNLSASGMKPFVEPHRTDPSKQIRYIAIEAPTADVYFRGTAQIAQGITKIEVPEHFRMVARPGSYATQVTPVGAMATVAVLSEDENGIVVRASRNVRVHYVVYAERDTFKDHNPIMENVNFRPDSEGRISEHMPEVYRPILIKNGTLNPDGSVNRETARRLGWDFESAKGSAAASH